MTLPDDGLPRDEVLARLDRFRADDLPTHGGRTWAYVYDAGRAEVEEVAKAAYLAFLSENGLDPTVYPSLLHIENEVLGIAARHLGGDEEVVGSFTAGGTESCMLAVKVARERARSRGVAEPTILLPSTAHAAFHKGCHYLDLEAVVVDVDPVTFRVDPQVIADAIDERTAMVVVSAPGYAHGVIDPIEEVATRCAERDVLCHVDGCVGAWLLPYFRELGEDIPPFDFSVDGVTSISMDFHKYGYAPKGASVVLYRDAALRRHQYFASASWTGYTVINATIQSTKSGGPLAGTWATLHALGHAGYLDIARDMRTARKRLLAGIAAIDGLEVLGDPRFSLVACAADGFSIFHVVDEMRERGWYVQPQLSGGGSPANVHFTVTGTSLHAVDPMLADLAASVEVARGLPADDTGVQVRAGFADFTPADFTPEVFGQMLDLAGLGAGAGIPERMAGINEILDNLPPALTEQLLISYLNELFRPAPRADGELGGGAVG